MTPIKPLELRLKQHAIKVENFIEEQLQSKKPKSLYDAAKHIIEAGGKRLRPFLVLRSCEAVGGEVETAIPFAAALELLHNFTLIHDDIMDNDELRRGVPTVHATWGIPTAITSGDLLFAKVYESMTKNSEKVPCKKVQKCIENVTNAAVAICEGQVLDLSFPRLTNVSEEDYFLMIGKKTSALFKACAEVGAIIGGGDPIEVSRLGSYAWNAGLAFQLIDDYLGITSDEKTLGKPVGSDLREGKKTLIIIHALKHASSPNRDRIERVLGVDDAATIEIEAVTELLIKMGSLRYTLDCAKRFAKKAKEVLAPFSDSEAKQDLLELVDYFMERTY